MTTAKNTAKLSPAALASAIFDAGFTVEGYTLEGGDGAAGVTLTLRPPTPDAGAHLVTAINTTELAELINGQEGRRAIRALLAGFGSLNISLKVDRESGALKGRVDVLTPDGETATAEAEPSGILDLSAAAASELPVGGLLDATGKDTPAGFLIANGKSLRRADWPELFEAIGTRYGAESEDRFNLPDYRGALDNPPKIIIKVNADRPKSTFDGTLNPDGSTAEGAEQ